MGISASSLRSTSAVLTTAGLALAITSLTAKFATTVETSILDLEHIGIAPTRDSTLTTLQTQYNVGLDAVRGVYATLDELQRPLDEQYKGQVTLPQDKWQAGVGAQLAGGLITQAEHDQAVAMYQPWVNNFSEEMVVEATLSERWGSPITQAALEDLFADKFRSLVDQTRTAVGMSITSIVCFMLSLSMLLNKTNSYVLVALQMIASIAPIVFLLMIQQNRVVRGELTEMGERLTGPNPSPEAEAGPAVYSSGISVACGFLGALSGGLSVKKATRKGKKASSSIRMEDMDTDEESSDEEDDEDVEAKFDVSAASIKGNDTAAVEA